MAGSVPCVCHRAGECVRLIDDGKSGMLADGPEEWEAKLEQLVCDPRLRQEMGRAGLVTVRAAYSFEKAVDDLEAAFGSVLEKRRARSPLTAGAQVLDQIVRLVARTLYRVLTPGSWGR